MEDEAKNSAFLEIRLVDCVVERVEEAKTLEELLKEVDEVLDVLDAGHLANPGQ